jgi:hypothetical protein
MAGSYALTVSDRTLCVHAQMSAPAAAASFGASSSSAQLAAAPLYAEVARLEGEIRAATEAIAQFERQINSASAADQAYLQSRIVAKEQQIAADKQRLVELTRGGTTRAASCNLACGRSPLVAQRSLIRTVMCCAICF